MKKNFLSIVFLLILVLLNSSCLSAMLLAERPNKKIDIPYYSVMDTRFGYEDLYWGITFDEAEKLEGYPIKKYRSNNINTYFYGEYYKYTDGTISPIYYGHGIVDSTKLYFNNNRLYKVIDKLDIKNPSLEILHERYGEFSDKNVLSDYKNINGFKAIYSNKDSFNGYFHSIQIEIANDGTTTVFISDPFTLYSIEQEPIISNYLKDIKPLPVNHWYMLGSTDGKNKDFDLIFLNKNEDDVYAVIYYKKNKEPALSTLRAGIHITHGNTYGTYELKTKDGLREIYLENKSYNFKSIEFNLDITDNNKLSTREMLSIFLENSDLTFRKNNKVSTLKLDGLEKAFELYGITFDELDFAIANEEF